MVYQDTGFPLQLLLLLLLLLASYPGPLSLAKAIPLSSPSLCLQNLSTLVEPQQPQIADKIPSPFFTLLSMKAEEGSVCENVCIHAHAGYVFSRAGPEPCGVGDVHVGSGGE